MSTLRLVAVTAALLSSTSFANEAIPFGPFDAGSSRSVERQAVKGLTRRAHPAVGDRDHIPGGGPPRPAIRPLFFAALIYGNFLTRVDGPRCQHLPTCSRFASQAVARHGLLGIALGLDRVIQPAMSSTVRLLPDVEFGDSVRHYDPLENYEFWVPGRFSGFPQPTPEMPLRFSNFSTDDVTPPEQP